MTVKSFKHEQCKRCVPKIRRCQVCQGSWNSETLSYNVGESLGGDVLQSTSVLKMRQFSSALRKDSWGSKNSDVQSGGRGSAARCSGVWKRWQRAGFLVFVECSQGSRTVTVTSERQR